MSIKRSFDDDGESLSELMDELQDVDENAPDASLNETTISDNNGGRIELDENERDPNLVNKPLGSTPLNRPPKTIIKLAKEPKKRVVKIVLKKQKP